MISKSKFWPWGDPEGEIYENLAWDLPGFRTARGKKRQALKRTPKK